VDLNAVDTEFIDVEDALKRVGGNVDLYKRLLKRFIEGSQFTELETVLQDGNTEEAARLTHTIKGVSANLSLIKLRTISVEMEQLLKDGLDHSVKLDEFKQAYDETLKIIAGIV
jgi:HPt (histidine-containing phosphotransfer) domain-containing protein